MDENLVEFGSALRQEFQGWSDRLLRGWLTDYEALPELWETEDALDTHLSALTQECVTLYESLTAGFPSPGSTAAIHSLAELPHASHKTTVINSRSQPPQALQTQLPDFVSTTSAVESDRDPQPSPFTKQTQYSTSSKSSSSPAEKVNLIKVRHRLQPFLQEIEGDQQDSYLSIPNSHLQPRRQHHHKSQPQQDSSRTETSYQQPAAKQSTSQIAIAATPKNSRSLISVEVIPPNVMGKQLAIEKPIASSTSRLSIIPLSTSETFIAELPSTPSSRDRAEPPDTEAIPLPTKGLKDFANQFVGYSTASQNWTVDNQVGNPQELGHQPREQVSPHPQTISDRSFVQQSATAQTEIFAPLPAPSSALAGISEREKQELKPSQFKGVRGTAELKSVVHPFEDGNDRDSPTQRSRSDLPVSQHSDVADRFNFSSSPSESEPSPPISPSSSPDASLDTLLEALEAEINRDYYRHYGI